jgi:hypothetical protein
VEVEGSSPFARSNFLKVESSSTAMAKRKRSRRMLASWVALTILLSPKTFPQALTKESLKCRLISAQIASAAPSDITTAIASLPLTSETHGSPHGEHWEERKVPSSMAALIRAWHSQIPPSTSKTHSTVHHLEQALHEYEKVDWRRENIWSHLNQGFKSLKRKRSTASRRAQWELDLAYSAFLDSEARIRIQSLASPTSVFKNRNLVELVFINALRASNLGWLDLWAVSQAGRIIGLPSLEELKPLISQWIRRSEEFLEGTRGLNRSGLLLPYFGDKTRHELNFVATLPILTVESATATGFADGRVHTPLEKTLHDLFDHAQPIWSAFSTTPLSNSLDRYFALMAIYQKAMERSDARQQEWIADVLFLIHERPVSFRSLMSSSAVLENLRESALASIFYRSSVQGDYSHSFLTPPDNRRVAEIKRAIAELTNLTP